MLGWNLVVDISTTRVYFSDLSQRKCWRLLKYLTQMIFFFIFWLVLTPLLFTGQSKYSWHNFGDKMISFVSLKESFITHLDVSCPSTCRIDLQSSQSAVMENFQLSTAPQFSTYNTCIGVVIGLKSLQVQIGGLKAVWWINQTKELHCLFIDMGK